MMPQNLAPVMPQNNAPISFPAIIPDFSGSKKTADANQNKQ